MKYRLFCLIVLLFMPSWVIASEISRLDIGKFSQAQLHGWKSKVFNGKTHYQFVVDSEIHKTVLQARSQASASGLFFKKKINIEKMPYLHWSWKPKQVFPAMNENNKSGDDFVARIYVVIDGGIFFWRTLALNYVWSSSHKKDAVWDNPYTSNAKMLAVETGSVNLGHWQYYKRNVRNDLKAVFGKDFKYIDAIAIMTDTDNSGLQAENLFGDIFFTSK